MSQMHGHISAMHRANHNARRHLETVEQRQQHLWELVHANLQRKRFDRSPFVPTKFEEYQSHMRAMALLLKHLRTGSDPYVKPIRLDLGLVEFCGLGGLVTAEALHERTEALGQVTVFAPTYRPTAARPEPPWPTEQELREEGDERHTSGYSRFLPIPRRPAEGRSIWKYQQYMAPLEMDQVRPVPKKYADIQLPFDYERCEPLFDDDGVPVDDPMEAGKIAFLGDSAPASKPLHADQWTTQYFGEVFVHPAHLELSYNSRRAWWLEKSENS